MYNGGGSLAVSASSTTELLDSSHRVRRATDDDVDDQHSAVKRSPFPRLGEDEDDEDRDKRLPRLGLRSTSADKRLPRLGKRLPRLGKRLPRLGLRSLLTTAVDDEDERSKRLPRLGEERDKRYYKVILMGANINLIIVL